MKKILYLMVFSLLMASCDQVVFEEPQPRKVKALQEFPEALHGAYLDYNDDTLIIRQDSFMYRMDAIIDPTYFKLSDGVVLKQYKEWYYLNILEDINGEAYWELYLIDHVKDSNLLNVYAMDPGDIVKLAKLQEITSKVRDIEPEDSDDSYYLFAPKKKHYKKIIADTVFTKMVSFKRID